MLSVQFLTGLKTCFTETEGDNSPSQEAQGALNILLLLNAASTSRLLCPCSLTGIRIIMIPMVMESDKKASFLGLFQILK